MTHLHAAFCDYRYFVFQQVVRTAPNTARVVEMSGDVAEDVRSINRNKPEISRNQGKRRNCDVEEVDLCDKQPL